MANRRYSERTPDGTSDPLHDDDLIGVSNTDDSGLTYNLSKKIKLSVLKLFLGILGVSQDIVVVGSGAGTEASNAKIGDDGDPDDMFFGHEDLTSNRFQAGFYQGFAGNTSINATTGQTLTLKINNDQKVLIKDLGVQMAAIVGQIVVIGRVIGTGIAGTKLEVEGLGLTNATAAIIATDSDGVRIFTTQDDGSIILRNGTSISEFSIDGTLAGDSDDAVPTEKAVKTYVDGLITPQIIGGVTLSSSSNTNILNGTYVILADTTTVTSVTSGIGQDSNWTLEITEAGITNQKGVVTFTGNLEKDGGGGANYDVAIFKNGSIVSESEQIDQKLESGGKGQSVTVSAIVEFSTNDTFSIRVSGNGTADDIFCGGGSLYLR
jgi:hypothetical protein